MAMRQAGKMNALLFFFFEKELEKSLAVLLYSYSPVPSW